MYRMQKHRPATTAMHWQIHKTGARHFRRAKELGLRASRSPSRWAAIRRSRTRRPRRCPTASTSGCSPASCVRESGEDREVQDRRPRGPGRRRLRARGLRRPAEELFDEGPFGDHTGYYTPVDRFPRFHVTALTHRATPSIPATIVGPPPMEDAWLGKATERLFLPLLR
jgi:4-hydroxy-3-polyprenylbenzoate decarboxylase